MAGDPESVVREVGTVYSLPDTFMRLTETINNPRSGSADIAKVVATDTGLSARLLRLANSAMYGFPRRIETIPHAITMIGTSQIQQLTLAVSVVAVFKNIPPSLIDMASFWKHSFGCGLLSRLMAQQARKQNPERFFVAGLLHDIGRLVLFMKRPNQIRDAIVASQQTGASLVECERKALGYHHGDVGAILMEKWKIPPQFQQAAEYHHTPTLAKSAHEEVSIVHLADIAANAMAWGTSGQRGVPAFSAKAWDVVGLHSEMLPSLIEETEQQIDETMKIIISAA